MATDLLPVHVPYLQMLTELPPRPIGVPCPPGHDGALCGCDDGDEDETGPGGCCKGVHCAC